MLLGPILVNFLVRLLWWYSAVFQPDNFWRVAPVNTTGNSGTLLAPYWRSKDESQETLLLPWFYYLKLWFLNKKSFLFYDKKYLLRRRAHTGETKRNAAAVGIKDLAYHFTLDSKFILLVSLSRKFSIFQESSLFRRKAFHFGGSWKRKLITKYQNKSAY